MKENAKLKKVKEELLNAYRDLKEINRQIEQAKQIPDQSELTLLVARRQAMFEVINYLRQRALCEAVAEAQREEKKLLPSEINALKIAVGSRKRDVRKAIEEVFPSLIEGMFVLGAKWSGTTAIVLPDGFTKPAREAQSRAANGEIAHMERDIMLLEQRLGAPVDTGNDTDRISGQVMAEAMERYGFDFTKDWLEPFFRGQ